MRFIFSLEEVEDQVIFKLIMHRDFEGLVLKGGSTVIFQKYDNYVISFS